MISIKRIEKGKYYKPAISISFDYSAQVVYKIKELSSRRYNPDSRSWEAPLKCLGEIRGLFGKQLIESAELKALTGIQTVLMAVVHESLLEIVPVMDYQVSMKPYLLKVKV